MNLSIKSEILSSIFTLIRIILFIASICAIGYGVLIALALSVWSGQIMLLIVVIPLAISFIYLLYQLLFHKSIAKFVKVFIAIVLSLALMPVHESLRSKIMLFQ